MLKSLAATAADPICGGRPELATEPDAVRPMPSAPRSGPVKLSLGELPVMWTTELPTATCSRRICSAVFEPGPRASRLAP